MRKGIVFNIQRYSLHDGPGIRTTIFFKGCPLSCWWCQNPESINPHAEVMRQPERCLGCSSCLDTCPEGAVRIGEAGPVIERSLCSRCLKCALVCPADALEAVGREYTTQELVKEALKDRFIFDNSGGGISFSGGEPLLQPEFLQEVLKALKKEGVHTVIDTSGCAPWKVLEQLAVHTDLFLYDIKLIDDLESRKYTGTSSYMAINNLKILTERGFPVQVRMPVIPSITDHLDNIDAIVKVLKECGLGKLELIPYHNYGTAKYNKLDLEYRPGTLEIPAAEELSKIKARFEKQGIKIINEDD